MSLWAAFKRKLGIGPVQPDHDPVYHDAANQYNALLLRQQLAERRRSDARRVLGAEIESWDWRTG